MLEVAEASEVAPPVHLVDGVDNMRVVATISVEDILLGRPVHRWKLDGPGSFRDLHYERLEDRNGEEGEQFSVERFRKFQTP